MSEDGTFLYEYVVKWFGLRIRSVRIDAESGAIVWQGPWRWKRERAFNDGIAHAFQIYVDIFNSEATTS